MTTRTIADIDVALGSGDFARPELVSIAQVADQLGVGNLFLTEGTGRDTFSLLTEIALKTRHIGLGTGIVNIFSRTPTALAQCTATVMELMGDRAFNLGLGTSGKQLMRKYHGVAYERPVSRMREAVRIIDTAFTTGRIPEGGDIFPLAGLPLGLAAPRSRLKIYVAGLSAPTLDVTGRNADGWLPIWFSIDHGQQPLEQARSSAKDAGRGEPIVSAFCYGGVGAGEDLKKHIRSTLAWYVAANGTAYRRLFESYGYVEEVARICELWAAGKRQQARESVPDHLLADTALFGNPPEFLAAVDRFIAAGVDRPVLRMQSQLTAAEVIKMLADLAAYSGR